MLGKKGNEQIEIRVMVVTCYIAWAMICAILITPAKTAAQIVGEQVVVENFDQYDDRYPNEPFRIVVDGYPVTDPFTNDVRPGNGTNATSRVRDKHCPQSHAIVARILRQCLFTLDCGNMEAAGPGAGLDRIQHILGMVFPDLRLDSDEQRHRLPGYRRRPRQALCGACHTGSKRDRSLDRAVDRP